MMTAAMVMRFDHGRHGMKGITLNEKSLESLAVSLHSTTQLEQDLLNGKEDRPLSSTLHEDEGKGHIASDCENRQSIREALEIDIHPFSQLESHDDIVNIHTGQLFREKFNVDQRLSTSKDRVEFFYESFTNGFYKPLSKKVAP